VGLVARLRLSWQSIGLLIVRVSNRLGFFGVALALVRVWLTLLGRGYIKPSKLHYFHFLRFYIGGWGTLRFQQERVERKHRLVYSHNI